MHILYYTYDIITSILHFYIIHFPNIMKNHYKWNKIIFIGSITVLKGKTIRKIPFPMFKSSELSIFASTETESL